MKPKIKHFNLIKIFFPIFLSFFSSFIYSQNKIYCDDGTYDGSVVQITKEKIFFRKRENPDIDYTVKREKVKLLFNELGNFLLIQKLEFIDKKSEDLLIKNFTKNSNVKKNDFDKIYTTENTIINAVITNEDDTIYYLKTNENKEINIGKSKVALIIFKDGSHKIISNLSIVIESLKNSKPEIKQTKSNEFNNSDIKSNQILSNTERDTFNFDNSNQTLSKTLNTNTYEIEKKAKLDSIKLMKDNAKNFLQAKFNAKKSLDSELFVEAKKYYLIALTIKPGDIDTKNMIDSIDFIINTNNTFDSLINYANSIINIEPNKSIELYKAAKKLKPLDYYSGQQIKYLEKEIANNKIIEEARLKKEAEERFDSAKLKGDSLKRFNFEGALSAYYEAQQIHPDDKYVIEMIRIMKIQIDKNKKKTEINN
jgi:hypothetical protein